MPDSAHPQLPYPNQSVHMLPDVEFIDKSHHLDGTPEEVLQNDENLGLALPMLRADFGRCETYHYHEKVPLAYPIVAFCGKEDAEISAEELAKWHQQQPLDFNYICSTEIIFLQGAQHLLIQFIFANLAPTLERDSIKIAMPHQQL